MLGAVAWTCTRPIEIVIRPKFLFDFHVSDAYVFAQLFDACLYYFFMLVVVVRYETAATARRALLFIVRAFFNDTIAVAVWTGFHVRLMGMLPQPADYIRWCFADPAIAARQHDVRLSSKSRHSQRRLECPLGANSGHKHSYLLVRFCADPMTCRYDKIAPFKAIFVTRRRKLRDYQIW